MPSHLPSEITAGLVSLRRRIRRIQFFRGLLWTGGIALAGLLMIVGLDFFITPFPGWARGAVFFLWLAAIMIAVVGFILKPMLVKLPLLRLARWLEERHPEVQERISTALELADQPRESGGISPDLLADLSADAAADMSRVDPRQEVQSKRVHRAMIPVAAGLVALVVLVAVWPRQMERLLTRAVSPFSELGNAGAFRFEITPGDVEVLEGAEFTIDLTFTGPLDQALEFVIEKEDETFTESLQPSSSEGGEHRFSYPVHSADLDFKYSARVAGSESDRFEVKVHSLPRLLDPVVVFQYPPYTGWPDREVSLNPTVQALAGTEVVVKGRVETPLESAELLLNATSFGEVTLDPSARGTAIEWSGILKPGLDETAILKVKHQLGPVLEAAQFHLLATEDPAPVVKLLTPVQRKLRVKPDEQVMITYEVVERIGLAKAEIELEVNGKPVQPLLELLPERIDFEKGDRWEGEAVVFLGNLVAQHKGARKFRMRLALSDQRPAELEGPGVGYSEWLEIELDRNAESLVRQELRKQDRDVRDTVQEAIQDIQKARNKMHEAKGGLHKEVITEKGEKALAEAREKLQEGQGKLTALSERMKQGVQDHRRDEVAAAVAKLEEAKEALSHAPLRDTPEARKSEVDHALRQSESVLKDLHKLREDVQKDQPRTDDLAKLQEMAQRQEKLAKEASGKELDEDWKNQQRVMREKIRQQVKESPQAKAAALAAQSKQAMELAQEAAVLQQSQDELGKLSQASKEEMSAVLEQALAREQAAVVEGVKEQLSEARSAQEERANDLPEALAQAEAALDAVQKGKGESAPESAQKAAQELGKGAENSATQAALQEKQEKLAEALQNLVEGKEGDALAALEEMQAERAAELADEIQGIAEVEGNEFRSAEQQAKQGAQKATQASQSQQAGNEAAAAKAHAQSAQKFAETGQSLERASKQLAQRAEQAAKQAENARKAPAPGDEMAEALAQSAKAAKAADAGDSQEAAASAKAAAEALQKAAQEAKATMKRGGKPGEQMPPGEQPGPGEGGDPGEESKEGLREAQGDQGVPPELAKLGISAGDWEKIKATMTTDVSGSRRTVIPEDYRGLVKKYFEEVTKER